MSQAEDEDSLIRRYLLGRLAAEERDPVEQRVLTDADFRDRVLAAEDDLLEDYADGALDPRDRREFQRVLAASPRRLRDAQVVAELKRHAAADAPPAEASTARGWLDWLRLYRRPAAAFALVAVAAVAVVFLAARRAPRDPAPPASPSAVEQARRARVQKELARLNGAEARESDTPPLAATLLPGLSRSDETRPAPAFPTVAVARDGESVSIGLTLQTSGAGYEGFQAALSPVGGVTTSAVDLKPVAIGGGRALVLTLPARELDSGDYRVQLSGRTADGRAEPLPDHYYYFRLARP